MHKPTFLIAVILALIVLCTLLASAATGGVITGWALVAPLPQPVAYHRAAAYGDTIYVVGGEVPDWATPVASLIQAQIETDGAITQWATPTAIWTVPLPQSLNRHAVVQAHWDVTDFLYVIGGFSKGNRYADVWRADLIPSTSQLGNWQEVRNYPRKIVLHEAVYSNGYLFVLGGLGEDDKPLKEVYSAKLNANGELETWQSRRELPKPLYRFAVTRYTTKDCRAYLFVVGGYDGEQAQRNVYVAEAHYDGTLSEWHEQELLPRALAYHQAIVYRDRLVVIGGSGSDDSYNEVYSTSINLDSSLGHWESEADLPESLTRVAVALVTIPSTQLTELYVLGGKNGDDFRSQVYRSQSAPPSIATGITYENPLYLPLIKGC